MQIACRTLECGGQSPRAITLVFSRRRIGRERRTSLVTQSSRPENFSDAFSHFRIVSIHHERNNIATGNYCTGEGPSTSLELRLLKCRKRSYPFRFMPMA